MKNCNLLPVFIFSSLLISCSDPMPKSVDAAIIKNYKEIEKANWLLGSWHNVWPDGTSIEMWHKINDSTFAGKSFFVVGKDTVSSESIVLSQSGTSLYYIPTVKDQNKGMPVKFALTRSTADQLIFENPEHDFPNTITYNKITADSLLAEISGMREGKPHAVQFPMKRTK